MSLASGGTTAAASVGAVDLTTCDREPIHVPNSIQPHGYLIVLDGPDWSVARASRNCVKLFDRPIEQILGARLEQLLGKTSVTALGEATAGAELEANPLYVGTFRIGEDDVNGVMHRFNGQLIFELERTSRRVSIGFQNLYPLVRTFVQQLERVETVEDLSQLTAAEVRRVSGFDRVLIYRFDEDANGTVIAEDRNDQLPSYLDLRFPASDIPAQARQLYTLNRVRLIADADYEPVPILPLPDGQRVPPLDLSYAGLRSVSPIHVEYMRNMGTWSSMSISVLREGKLWGLISCHSRAPRDVPFEVRTACDFLGQTFALQLGATERRLQYEYRIQHRAVQADLLAHMTREQNFVDGLINHGHLLLKLVGATGAAIVLEDKVRLVGQTPNERQVKHLVEHIAQRVNTDVYATDSLAGELPEAAACKDVASGVMAIAISKLHSSYVIWFRQEVERTVKWSGDPRKPADPQPETGRIHPRKSFEQWKETVRLRSSPWQTTELEAAQELRNVIVGIVLRRAEELAQMSAELERSNKELEAFSYSVSHDLRAPFRHILGYSELLRETSEGLDDSSRRYIDTIVESAQYAGTLVDNLLTFSQMGRSRLNIVQIDMDQLVREVQRAVTEEARDREIEWRLQPLPVLRGDLMMIRLVVRNLLENAVKYTRPRPRAIIEVGAAPGDREQIYYVRDNGVGFDMTYVDKLFGVFQRLHRIEEFEGTGIGLANVRRIIARHGGRTWAEGKVGQGATFYLAVPRGGE